MKFWERNKTKLELRHVLNRHIRVKFRRDPFVLHEGILFTFILAKKMDGVTIMWDERELKVHLYHENTNYHLWSEY